MEKMGRYFSAVIVIFAAVVFNTESAKIAVFPMNMGSHILYIGQVGSGLAEGGHDVTLYVPSNNKPPQGLSPKVKIVVYKVPGDIPYGNSAEVAEMEIATLTTTSTKEWLDIQVEMQIKMYDAWNADCESLFVPEVFAEIEAAGYELAVVDPVMYTCLYTIPYKLGIPYVGVSVPYALWGYRIPHLSSMWPGLFTTSGYRMDFWQRLFGFSMDFMEEAIFSNNTDYFVRKYVPEKPVVGAYDLFCNMTMWWFLYDISVAYPRPSMPNTLDIGDVMVRPAKHLPEEYLDILQTATHGAILVSLGSHFDAVPDSWLYEFCQAFNSLPHTIIWKLKVKPPCDTAPNVHIKAWTPQNDLLAHPNLVLFVTHCGYNSILESVSHGKPMIGFPISLDQPYNAQLMKDKGMGEVLQLNKFTGQELKETVQKVLGDKSYKENAQKASRLLHNKPETPSQRISYWVQHLVEHGNAHLVSEAAKELNLVQFLMMDIYFFLFAVILVIVVMVVVLLRCCCRCMLRCVRGKPGQKQHAD